MYMLSSNSELHSFLSILGDADNDGVVHRDVRIIMNQLVVVENHHGNNSNKNSNKYGTDIHVNEKASNGDVDADVVSSSSISSSTRTTTSSSITTRRRRNDSFCQTPWSLKMPSQIYTCGYNFVDLFQNIFPEFKHVKKRTKLTRKNVWNTTSYDVLVVGVGGYCDGWGSYKLNETYFEKHFHGFVFHFNGESFGGESWDVSSSSPRLPSSASSTTTSTTTTTTINKNNNSNNDMIRTMSMKNRNGTDRGNGTNSLPYNMDYNNKTTSSYRHNPPLRNIHIGYVPDTSQSVQVPFISQFVSTCSKDLQNKLFVPYKKPQNNRKYFMIYAVSNCNVKYREEAVDHIATQLGQPIDQGGKCWGKSHNRSLVRIPDNKNVPIPKGNRHWHKNYKYYQNYRFCLVMENKYQYGYITEKIALAYMGGCIPIYYGTRQIFHIFHSKSFIYYDISNPKYAIEQIQYLEKNHTAYNEILQLQQPILRNGNETIKQYFSLSSLQDDDHDDDDDFGIGYHYLKKKIRDMVCNLSSSSS